MRIERVFNNNVVLCRDDRDQPVMLLAKGLGFGRRPGDTVSAEGAQQFVTKPSDRPDLMKGLLDQASGPEVDTAGAIVQLAQERLGLPPSQALLLPILDHLCGAVVRAQQGVQIDFPLVFEVGQLYPREAAAGRAAIALAQERLGVTFQAEESVAFALHMINQQWAHSDLGRTMAMTTTLNGAFDLLEELWTRRIDRTSVAAGRFVTHLRYLFARSTMDARVGTIDLLETLNTSEPAASHASERMARLLEGHLGHELNREERSFLTLHLARLHRELAIDAQ